jgi:hypothetical protein
MRRNILTIVLEKLYGTQSCSLAPSLNALLVPVKKSPTPSMTKE